MDGGDGGVGVVGGVSEAQVRCEAGKVVSVRAPSKVVFVCKDCSFVTEDKEKAKDHASVWSYDDPNGSGKRHRVARFEQRVLE